MPVKRKQVAPAPARRAKGYQPERDRCLLALPERVLSPNGDRLTAGVYSYNGGPPKLRIVWTLVRTSRRRTREVLIPILRLSLHDLEQVDYVGGCLNAALARFKEVA